MKLKSAGNHSLCINKNMKNIGPTNYIFNGDPNLESDVKLWFKCPKCKVKIWKHLYNEHKYNCKGKKNVALKQNMKEQQSNQPRKRQKIELPQIFGSTRSRHRRPTRGS